VIYFHILKQIWTDRYQNFVAHLRNSDDMVKEINMNSTEEHCNPVTILFCEVVANVTFYKLMQSCHIFVDLKPHRD
jgi:hypothetical protein